MFKQHVRDMVWMWTKSKLKLVVLGSIFLPKEPHCSQQYFLSPVERDEDGSGLADEDNSGLAQ